MAREIGSRRVFIPTTKAVEALRRVGFRDFPNAVLQGSTEHFNVYYNPPLGAAGRQIANGVLGVCERDYQGLSQIFGGITPTGLPVNIVLAHLPQGGAYHYGCSATTLYCDVRTAPSVAPAFSSFLALAELVEVFEAAQGRGWNCGASNGEGLSRVLATASYPRQIVGFGTAAAWLNQGRPDFVNRTDPTDGNPLSTGCAVLFLNYLRYQLSYRWRDIAAAAGPKLSVTYLRLTGDASNPFPRFTAVLASRFPAGQQSALNTDNPFPIRQARPSRLGGGARGGRHGPPRAAGAAGEAPEAESGIAVMIPTDVDVEESTTSPSEVDEDEETSAPDEHGAAPPPQSSGAGSEVPGPESSDPDGETAEDDSVPGVSEQTGGVIGNKNTRIYRPATSGNLPSEENRVYFKSEDEAIAAGFRRAGRVDGDNSGS